jgi:hypothetical protein
MIDTSGWFADGACAVTEPAHDDLRSTSVPEDRRYARDFRMNIYYLSCSFIAGNSRRDKIVWAISFTSSSFGGASGQIVQFVLHNESDHQGEQATAP